MDDLRAASIRLSELFISEVEKRCPEMTLASPRDPAKRASQVSFSYEHGYAAIQAMIAQNVIGDYRHPNVMRFGFTPLFLDEDDVLQAVHILQVIIAKRLWDNPKFTARQRVT